MGLDFRSSRVRQVDPQDARRLHARHECRTRSERAPTYPSDDVLRRQHRAAHALSNRYPQILGRERERDFRRARLCEHSFWACDWWVRVTKTGPANWSTKALGFSGTDQALVARHEARQTAAGAALTDVTSTWVDKVGYDSAGGLMVTQIGDRLYGHAVHEGSYARMKNATAPGTVLNALVKGQPRVQLIRCAHCRRFSAQDAELTCPPESVRRGNFDRPAAASQARAARRRAAKSIGWANRVTRRPYPGARGYRFTLGLKVGSGWSRSLQVRPPLWHRSCHARGSRS